MASNHSPNLGNFIADHPLRILTVGDGDFSCSLAILRAYWSIIDCFTATTLVSSRPVLLETYESASGICEELESMPNVSLLYGVDATKLHRNQELAGQLFDVILFHHPHLGYDYSCETNDAASENTETLRNRHQCLLSHYLDSARNLLRSPNGAVHVCLTSGAVHRWKLENIVARLQLKHVWNSPRVASGPLFPQNHNDGKDPLARRKVNKSVRRKGHWLGRYGYRHQPTSPRKTIFETNVSSSFHFFLRPQSPVIGCGDESNDLFKCQVCEQVFQDKSSLYEHFRHPMA